MRVWFVLGGMPISLEKRMVRKNSLIRFAFISSFAAFGMAAHAITFSNVIILSPPLSNGSSFTALGNSISFFTPNAVVGDSTHPLRAGTLNIQYDATNFGGQAMTANSLSVFLAAAAQGSGTVLFTEMIIELDANGNELGLLGTSSHLFTAQSSSTFNDTIQFSHQVFAFRAKKSFTLSAPDTAAVDLAAVATTNQAVHLVPEPATMAAFGLGAIALLRRKQKK